MRRAAHARSGTRPATLFASIAAALLLATLAVPAWTHASDGVKVVVVVGPVARFNDGYKEEAREVVAEARRHTSNVVVLFTPRATWSRVRTAAAGASVFVYFGHGWGNPSPYGPFDPDRMNGMALDPPHGADGRRRVYYGERRIRESIRFAPGAAVLLYRLCYASGNTEPGMSEGSTASSRRRVDGYASGFLDAGAGVVFADGHPRAPANYVRQLFVTDRSMWDLFRRAPNFHEHVLGLYGSRRTNGARYALDPDHGGTNPSDFYRSVVGDLELRTTEVTNRVPPPTATPEPTPQPSPTGDPEPTPTIEPTAEPTAEPTPEPTPAPTAEPTPEPTPAPTPEATAEPTPAPTAEPTPAPTPDPTPTLPTP